MNSKFLQDFLRGTQQCSEGCKLAGDKTLTWGKWWLLCHEIVGTSSSGSSSQRRLFGLKVKALRSFDTLGATYSVDTVLYVRLEVFAPSGLKIRMFRVVVLNSRFIVS
jgi:hypothetical protein